MALVDLTTVATAKATMGMAEEAMGATMAVEEVVGTGDGGITVPPINATSKLDGIKVFCLLAVVLPMLWPLNWLRSIARISMLLGKFAQERANTVMSLRAHGLGTKRSS